MRTKLGALKTIVKRGCVLNNLGQKLFQLGCALNKDNYGDKIKKQTIYIQTYDKYTMTHIT